jgi:replicative DNA helicase
MAESGGPKRAQVLLSTARALALDDMTRVGSYLAIVEEEGRMRRITAACERALANAADGRHGADKLLSALADDLKEIESASGAREIETLADIFEREFEELTALQEGRREPDSLTTTIPSLDSAMAGGLHAGETTILSAPSGGGKTTLAMQMLMHHALVKGEDVLFISVEMSEEQVFQKTLSHIFSVSLSRVRSGRIAMEEEDYSIKELKHEPLTWPHIVDIVRQKRPERHFDRLPRLHIVSKRGYTVSQLVSSIWKKKLELERAGRTLRLVVLDYLQIVEADVPLKNRELEINFIARKLVAAAKEAGIAQVLISQVNDDGKLRESRAIFHHADSVIYLSPKPEEKRVTIQVDKGRMHASQMNPVTCDFLGEIGLFREVVRKPASEPAPAEPVQTQWD